MTIFNTDIDGVPISGISIKNIHHHIYIPKDTTLDPALPSGSLWLRSYNDVVETLTYQGTSGILEVLNAQGWAFYSTNTRQTLSTSSPVIMELILKRWTDSSFISSSAFPRDSFTINVKGLYSISYTLRAINETGGGNADGVIQTRVLANGSEIAGSNTKAHFTTPTRRGDCTGGGYILASLNIGDVIQFEIEVIAGGGSSMFYKGAVTFKFIRPETT